MEDKGEIAKEYFESGYNCAQSVVLAFSSEIGLDEKLLATMTSGLGGGIGRMRETCGTIVGMGIVLSLLSGKDKPTNEEKKQLYESIQNIGKRFKEENGSLICAELLGLKKKIDEPKPDERSAEYYKKRPCAMLCKDVAKYIEEYLMQARK